VRNPNIVPKWKVQACQPGSNIASSDTFIQPCSLGRQEIPSAVKISPMLDNGSSLAISIHLLNLTITYHRSFVNKSELEDSDLPTSLIAGRLLPWCLHPRYNKEYTSRDADIHFLGKTCNLISELQIVFDELQL
jgi:hypothetical protein